MFSSFWILVDLESKKISASMKFTPKISLRYSENFGKLICLLPLYPESTTTLKILNGVGCFISIINFFGILLSFLCTAYFNIHENILVTEILGFVMIYLEPFLNILFWRLKSTEFQKFLQEFDNFIKTAKENEKKIIDKYFSRYKYFYVFMTFFATGSFLLRITVAPILQPQKIPFAIWYPFSVKPFTVTHYVIFISQSIASFQCSSQLIFPIIVATIFLHVSMKLEILAHELKNAKNNSQLVICIQQHQECIQLVEHINKVLGGLIMKTYIIVGLSIIFGSIKFIYNPNFFTIARTFSTITCCLIGTYIYNGPADDLYEMSQVIAYSLYDLEWNDELIEMRKSIIIVMCRSQKPLVISPLNGLMPALNRKIYTSFLSYLISYIMTLRAIVSTK